MTQRTCSIDGCDSAHYGRGWCRSHWKRWRRWGDPEYDGRPRRQGVDPCSIAGCEGLLYARGWCTSHYRKWRRTGTTDGAQRQKRKGVAPCAVDGCPGTYFNSGLCSPHYYRKMRHGDAEYRIAGEVINGKRICIECGDDLPVEHFRTYKVRCMPCGASFAASCRPEYEPKRYLACVCDYCGMQFLGNAKQKRYCSRDCGAANKNRANWPHLNARRARLRAAFVETFDRLEIFERDGWVCGICRTAVHPELRWPDPMSASLDHIVPISRGGKHSRANAQCSHLACNVKKGASAA